MFDLFIKKEEYLNLIKIKQILFIYYNHQYFSILFLILGPLLLSRKKQIEIFFKHIKMYICKLI